MRCRFIIPLVMRSAALELSDALRTDESRDYARRAVALTAGATGDVPVIVIAAEAWQHALDGEVSAARTLLDAAVPMAAASRDRLLGRLATTYLLVEQEDRAVEWLRRAAEGARTHGGPIDFAIALTALAEAELRRGQYLAAYATAWEVENLVLGTHAGLRGLRLSLLTRASAVLGRDQEARDHGKQALAIAHQEEDHRAPALAHAGLGHLELLAGNLSAAVHHLQAATRLSRQVINPMMIGAGGDFAEALALSGQATQANAVLNDLAQRGARSASRWTPVVVARPRAIPAAVDGPSPDVEPAFSQAVELAEQAAPLERARTALEHGAFLRRTGRRRQAQNTLHAAVTEFDAIGGEGWARRARRELVSIGDRPRNRYPSLAET